jgi:hypothetical protein
MSRSRRRGCYDYNAGEPTSECNSSTIDAVRYGFPTKQLFAGKSVCWSRTCPDTTRIFIGGQRSRTAWASFSPSMLPGMLMSVNSTEMSGRDSSRATASSASQASSATQPASSTTSTASIRGRSSSSTTRTTGGDLLGDSAITSMIRNNLHRNIPGRATVGLIGPVPRHSKETRLQIGVMSFARHLSKLPCQTQAFKLAL